MLILACEKVFREEELKRIIAHIKPDNLVSIKVFEKADFVTIGHKIIKGFTTVEMIRQNKMVARQIGKPKKILVVVAHPDDEVMGCGGTIINHVERGDEVYLAILGEGKTSRYSREELEAVKRITKKEIKILDSEVLKSTSILGINKLFRFNFPDNRFDSVDLLDIIKTLEGLKEQIHPDIIYTHHGYDLNIDHSRTFQAVITAFRPIAGEMTSKILAFETPSATEWQASGQGMDFCPNYYIDITNTLERKLQALACYQSELRIYPHPRSIKSIEMIARRWGINVGLFAAEPFMLIREILL